MISLKNILLIMMMTSAGLIVGQDNKNEMETTDNKIKSEAEWKNELTSE